MESYRILLNELEMYNPELLDKDRVLAVTKCDILDRAAEKKIVRSLPDDIPCILNSSITGEGLQELKDELWAALNETPGQ